MINYKVSLQKICLRNKLCKMNIINNCYIVPGYKISNFTSHKYITAMQSYFSQWSVIQVVHISNRTQTVNCIDQTMD